MRIGNASGIQIVVLSFAIFLLAIPLGNSVSTALGSSAAEASLIARALPFVLGAIALLVIPVLRRKTVDYLSKPIPPERRAEVVMVGLAKVLLGFALIGTLALWYWVTEGNSALEQRLRPAEPAKAFAEALSLPGILSVVLVGALLAPFIEEILFRGLLFEAWAGRWGDFAATLFTSALFASYHPYFLAAFTSAIVFAALVRRTGTLWSSIAVHSFFNLMMWYPLAGQFGFPDPKLAIGDITTWWLNLACLLFATVAVPAYVVLAVLRPHFPRPGAE